VGDVRGRLHLVAEAAETPLVHVLHAELVGAHLLLEDPLLRVLVVAVVDIPQQSHAEVLLVAVEHRELLRLADDLEDDVAAVLLFSSRAPSLRLLALRRPLRRRATCLRGRVRTQRDEGCGDEGEHRRRDHSAREAPRVADPVHGPVP
jgi:hypothetical protein